MTLDQINEMSYLDFSIYVERIFKLYEEDEKRKAEREKQKYEAMNASFDSLQNSYNMPSFDSPSF